MQHLILWLSYQVLCGGLCIMKKRVAAAFVAARKTFVFKMRGFH